MIEKRGNMFDEVGKCSAIVITTNGFVASRGKCVMGRGCAKEARDRWAGIDLALGKLIRENGNGVHPLLTENGTTIVSFPVKPETVRCVAGGINLVSHAREKYREGDQVPGFLAVAKPEIILGSVTELIRLSDACGFTRIVMPRPGCGAGELLWENVKPVLGRLLDDRFEVYTF